MMVENVVCMFCGALCDDLEVAVEQDEIKEVKRACTISRNKFLHHRENLTRPMVDGREVTLTEAVEEAARILSQAGNPLIYGLSSTSCEAQRKAIELAELVGGNIDSTSSVCHGPGSLAKQLVGVSTCTLGEVKNRADLVVFWGCNPAEAHLRHFSRYSLMPKGMHTPQGRKSRKVVVVDVRPSASSKVADIFLQVRPNSDYECLSTMRAMLKGEQFDLAEVGGVPLEQLAVLADELKNCRYGVMFFGMGLTMTRGKYMNVVAALSLVRDLNQFTKFMVIPMRGHGNVAGSENTLTWQTGYPFGVNFSRGYPRYNPGEFTAVDLLARREVDAALIIASDPAASLPRLAAEHLARIPTVVLDPHWNETTRLARVVIPVAMLGIEAEGTFYRMDNVPLRLKKLVSAPVPTDHDILEKIMERVRYAENN
jgi:formylmethanofuran dehydrogenase subunit B